LSVNKPIKKEISGIFNLRFTYKNVPVTVLERLTFKEPREVLGDLCALSHVDECFVLQTCNRIEIYAVAAENFMFEAAAEIAEYWRQRNNLETEKFYQNLERSFNSEALTHLLRLTSGLESMIVGEDQILGQVQKAFEEAKECGTVGWVLKTIFEKAINTGKKVRLKTKINKGAVSIGSAAVELLEEFLGSLRDKKIIIIGAGETGSLVGKALASRKYAVIFVANRTYERGVRLAKMLGGYAVRFDKVKDLLANVNAVIVATAAPHYVLTKNLIQEVLEKRMGRKLFIMDLSQPRNVEEDVDSLSNVELYNIDDLRGIAEKNLEMRRREIEKAEVIIKDELKHLELMLKRERAEPVIAALCSKAEEIRRRELNKALRMLGEVNDKQQKVINDLTLVLIERILYHPILNMRKAAINGDFDTILVAQKLFDLNLSGSE
jgi:glutamyl-tRNA reductase